MFTRFLTLSALALLVVAVPVDVAASTPAGTVTAEQPDAQPVGNTITGTLGGLVGSLSGIVGGLTGSVSGIVGSVSGTVDDA